MTHTDCRQVQHPIIPIIIRLFRLVTQGGAKLMGEGGGGKSTLKLIMQYTL